MSSTNATYTQDWTGFLQSSLSRLFPVAVDAPRIVVEIGSFEGRGTRLLFKHLVERNKHSRLYCVDPWQDVYVSHDAKEFADIDRYFVGQFQRFLQNTSDLGPQIVPLRGGSNEVVPMLTDRIDFAYIDGDHSPAQVFRDASMVLPLMTKGGIILFDDYKWEHGGARCALGVDRWLEINKSRIRILFKDDQVAVEVHTPISFHVYALCWNEERLLPHFLNHYREADRIIVFDNHSSDSGPRLVVDAGRELRAFDTQSTLDDGCNLAIKNNEWKQSSPDADWVIVQDLDEFLHFPRHPESIVAGLAEMRAAGVTIARAIAHDMYSDDDSWERASAEQSIATQVTHGKRITWFNYDKAMVFSPKAIREMNFDVGAHNCKPLGDAAFAPEQLRPMMLHFKHIGPRYEMTRRISFRERLSENNVRNKFGFQYSKTDVEHENDIKREHGSAEIGDLSKAMFPKPWVLTKPVEEVSSFVVRTHGDGDFIADRLAAGDVWEPSIARFIATCCQKEMRTTFIDLGANIGLHSFVALASGAEKVISVECHPRTVQYLRKGAMANGWPTNRYRIVFAAASDKSGQLLAIKGCPGNMGGAQVTHATKGSRSTTHTVKSLSVDDLASDIRSATNILIKLDLEGHEPEAVRGMTQILKDDRVKCLLIEINPLARDPRTLRLMLESLLQMGYATARCMLRHPPDEWTGHQSQLWNCTPGSKFYRELAAQLPHVTWNEIITTLEGGTVVQEVALFRF